MPRMNENWHALSAAQAADKLRTDPAAGLTAAEAARRLAAHGPNRLAQTWRTPWHRMLARQFANILIFILLAAAALSFVLGDLIDALAILAIVIVNGVLGFAQEWKAERVLAGLRGMLRPHCRVLRDGAVTDVEAAALIPGDIVDIRAGDIVPADLRLMTMTDLKADEAALTGESLPVDKDAAPQDADAPVALRASMAWMGTQVVNGRGRGIVVATGMATEFGRIAGLTESIREGGTRLQAQLGTLGRQLGLLAFGLAALTVAIGVLWGKPVLQTVMGGVSLAVAAVPEGLPAVVTIALALGIRVMARKKALLRNLQAAETLGATSVICTDKTGTLTRNEMTVQHIWTASGTVRVEGVGYAPEGRFLKDGAVIAPLEDADLRALLWTGLVCNDARIAACDGVWTAAGSPTEAALVTLAFKAGLQEPRAEARLAEFPFNSERKRMAVIHEDAQEGRLVHVKGAPEAVLSRCDRILRGGRAAAMDEAAREAAQAAYRDLAGAGMRVLALARKDAPARTMDRDAAEEGLVFLGMVGIIDPPRPEVADAIARTQAAGIRVLMVTGDSPDTAAAVAAQVGLSAARTVTGAQMADMDDAALAVLLREDVIFARTVPEDKYRIVKALQANGDLVAMTGDGVNDAPALKQADIGIAMGIRGTGVARGAADIVLGDDNFATIVAAIEEGRRQYANIRKSVRYLASSNIGEALAVFLNILTGAPLILLPIQILWINLVTDSVTSLSLTLEKAGEGVMRRAPRPRDERILDRRALLLLGLYGSYIALATLLVFHLYLPRDPALAGSMAFTAIVVMANVHALNFRSFASPMHRIGYASNPWLLGAIMAMTGLQLCALYVPLLQRALKTVPPGLADLGLIAAVALPLFLGTELYKTLRARRRA